MNHPNVLERTDLSGNPVTLQHWLAQLGKWMRLAERMGPLAKAIVWQQPVIKCLAWEFTWFDCISWMVRDVESHELVSGVWEGVPENLVRHLSSDRVVQAVMFPAARSCRLWHWNGILNEAIVRYDPATAFRDGRFLRPPPENPAMKRRSSRFCHTPPERRSWIA